MILPTMLHDDSSAEFGAISPMLEMGAYEWLWQQESGERKASFKVLAELFRDHPGQWPSELVNASDARACAEAVMARLRKRGVKSFSVRMQGAGDYPEGLKDAEHPLQFLYYRGDWDLAYSPRRVAIVGTRDPSEEGLRRTSKLVSLLVKEGVTIVSGLAKGVDTMAHQTAIDRGGDTIAVIGTPIDQSYPKENADLQERIARDFLLISQVPVLLYARRPPSVNRLFFPERNITMSALTQATVIVEAGETSGTLIQARAAFKQGRKLFILDSNFQNPKLTWPRRFAEQGAIRVRDFDDILSNLDAPAPAAQD
jgi:DNA processing protein